MASPSSSSGSSMTPHASSLPASVDGPGDALMTAARMVLKRRLHVVRLVRDAYDRMTGNRSVFAALQDDLATAFRMLLAWADRSYDRISWTPLVMLVAALCYFVLPFDAVPDLLAGIGFLDDVTVISSVLHSLRSELAHFRDWEGQF